MISTNRIIALLASAAGFSAVGLLARQSSRTRSATVDAVASGGSFAARITGYWPYAATDAERKMEGGLNDRKGHPIHTLEQHLDDSGKHPYVSVSGDDEIFPYGQRITIDEWPSATFRVVDTGSHFRGARKVYRVLGREPLDVAVASSKTKVVPNAQATIVRGDTLDKPSKQVAAAKFQGQRVAVGCAFDLVGAEPAFVYKG